MRLLYSFSLLLFLTIVLLQYTSTTTASPIPTTTIATATNNISKRGPPDDVSAKWNHPHGCPPSDDKDKRDLVARGGSDDDEEDCPTTTSPSSTHSPTATATSSPDHGYPPSDDPKDIYGAGYVTPQMGVAGAFLIVLGVYLMIFGFRGFRPTLAVSGFLTFGLITWVGMTNSQPPEGFTNDAITMLAVPAGLGVLGAILYALFWDVTIYLIGGMGGLAFGLFVLCWREDLVITSNVPRACFLVAISLFVAAVTFFVERYVILFATAFTGAFSFIVGVDFLAHTNYIAGLKSILDQNKLHRVEYHIETKTYVMMAMIILLFLISFGWQFVYNKGRSFGVNSAPAPPAGEKGGEGGGGEPPSEGGEAGSGGGGSEKKEE
ncbi:hypothetical protein RO3G_10694 [Lichtheimia corymbifera JMRC:FSU:9682]|uniref:TM7S3/TM198-like domain-containing protein n=1 Tax=Lichtheimia corymbifera JMRC:FSU:9682 TaxID=1263082 RepID=A0A068RMM2_9FUNG|nr:hypothetical protein RO3G_10694 [Lichtheimia corymbifera JMRC:FSU:9682]